MKHPSLHLGIHQQLTMTPQLQQAIRLLQLSGQELELEIQALLEANPLLEYDHNDDLYQKTSNLLENSSYLNKVNDNDKDNETSLQQHLLWQMDIAPLSRQERLIAIAIIDVISDDGYLGCTLEELCDTLKIQESLQVGLAEVEAVLYKIQQFEPLGVGARNLSECLSLQINALPESTPNLACMKKLVSVHLNALAKRDYSGLKSQLNLSEPELQSAIHTITQLDPKPGRQISPCKKSDILIPDLIVRKKKDVFVVELNMKTVPNLRINSEYLHLLKGARTKKAKDTQFFREHLKEAQWFLKGLNNRYATLLKVGKSIVKKQQAFLENGEEYMQGLRLHDIAEHTHLHESTISRITSQKYIYTPRGIFELKYFFSKQIANDSGITYSATAIRAALKKIIFNESSLKPHSDETLKTLLKHQGIEISRRTVSKYREALKIPSSHERRTSSLFTSGSNSNMNSTKNSSRHSSMNPSVSRFINLKEE